MTEQVSEWRRGWKTVVSGMLAMTVATGTPAVTGVVMHPLNEAFGWSRAAVAANVTLCSILALIGAPVVGALIARHGPRRVALGGIALAVPVLLLISATGGPVWTWYAAWLLFATINLGLTPTVWSTAVASLFEKSRGLALAITLSGGGLGYFIYPPLAVMAESRFGWRGVYWMVAVTLVLLLPIMLAMFRSLRDIMPAASASAGTHRHEPAALAGHTMAQALRTRQFWQLVALLAFVATAEGGMTVHLFPVLTESGLAKGTAAGMISAMGLSLVVGRLATGALLDRMAAPIVFAGSILLILASCIAAQTVHGSAAVGAVVAILLGLGSGGTVGATAYVTSRFFGLAGYAGIFGVLMGVFALAYGTAPALVGHWRDAAGSYLPVFIGLAIAAAIGTVLAATLGKGPAARGVAPA